MRGRILLGWLTREIAVAYLQNKCLFTPPLTTAQAEALWTEKKEMVEALGPRAVPPPAPLPMTPAEREAAERFLSFMRRVPASAAQVQTVVKLDPHRLVCRQSDISLDRANQHAENVHAATWSARSCLGPPQDLAGRSFAGFDPIGISVIEGRAVLWSGYHRCYARMAASHPDMTDHSILAAVTPAGNEAVTANPSLRAILLGECPPLLGDFLDERLFLEVELRHDRYNSTVPE